MGVLEISLNILGWIVGIVLSALLEHKLKVINRLQRRWYRIRNKQVKASMAFEFHTKSNFSDAQKQIKAYFRKVPGFSVKRSTANRIDFTADQFSISVVSSQKKTLFFEIERMECGMRDMSEKVNTIVSLFTKLSQDHNLLEEFVMCELILNLPYKVQDTQIYVPTGLNLKDYRITFGEPNYRSQVEMSIGKIKIVTSAKEAIIPVIGRFL